MTDEQMWNWAEQIMAGEGISVRSGTRRDPPLHILGDLGGEPRLWCSGSAAIKANTMTKRYCPKCLALAREMWDDLAGTKRERVPR